MDSVLLRKLSFKSTMTFGKYSDYTVQQILDFNKFDGIRYLIWVYYNSSNISFIDEVMDCLGITEELRIDKPGKLTDHLDFYKKRKMILSKTEKSKYELNVMLGELSRIKNLERMHLKSFEFRSNRRINLMNRNHGK